MPVSPVTWQEVVADCGISPMTELLTTAQSHDAGGRVFV
jgi:hypothetical protein